MKFNKKRSSIFLDLLLNFLIATVVIPIKHLVYNTERDELGSE